jgi:hypothetical protein
MIMVKSIEKWLGPWFLLWLREKWGCMWVCFRSKLILLVDNSYSIWFFLLTNIYTVLLYRICDHASQSGYEVFSRITWVTVKMVWNLELQTHPQIWSLSQKLLRKIDFLGYYWAINLIRNYERIRLIHSYKRAHYWKWVQGYCLLF